MTPDDFRRLALGLPGTEERAHMHHPDFRVGGKIYATLGYPEDGWAMVKLLPEQQYNFVEAFPAAFAPATGAWGRRGATTVRLKTPNKNIARRALAAAWRNSAPKSYVALSDATKSVLESGRRLVGNRWRRESLWFAVERLRLSEGRYHEGTHSCRRLRPAAGQTRHEGPASVAVAQRGGEAVEVGTALAEGVRTITLDS